jgi:nucleoside phosphorylase
VRRLTHAEARPGSLFNFHLGSIASGGAVIQDGAKRDLESQRCNYARCFEMEAVGVNISSRCLVIRGIADYADPHKNDLWKYKAAGNAAMFAKELLLKINPGVLEELAGIRSDRSEL